MLKSIKNANDLRSVEAVINAMRGNARRLADLGLCETMHQNPVSANKLNAMAGEILIHADSVEGMTKKDPNTSQFTMQIEPGHRLGEFEVRGIKR